MLFFFNCTAHTEIYQYCHTLSLHAALPIYGRAAEGRRCGRGGSEGLLQVRPRELSLGMLGRAASRFAALIPALLLLVLWTGPARAESGRFDLLADACAAAGARSEEHTSELQALMRISYAVFCLKKKKT